MAVVDAAFSYTGKTVPWQVPALVTEVTFRLWGAAGGRPARDGSGTAGLRGDVGAYATAPIADPTTIRTKGNEVKSLVGYVDVTIPVTPGDTYYFTVGGGGGQGNSNAPSNSNGGPGGFNGGGAGGHSNTSPWEGFLPPVPAGGGGGKTDVRYGGTDFDTDAIFVAGGGGGGAFGPSTGRGATANPVSPDPPYNLYDNTVDYTGPSAYASSGPAYGAPGGSSASGSGLPGGNSYTAAGDLKVGSGGKGGTQSGGGKGGVAPSDGTSGSDGSLGQGGAGANGINPDPDTGGGSTYPGGGGGGGHYGGGGGATGGSTSANVAAGAGGGGGSNFVATGLSAVINLSTSAVYPVHGLAGFPLTGAGQKYYGSPNGLATVTYNQPPNAPTILTPANGASVPANGDLAMEWEFASVVVGEFQAGYDLEYSVSGDDSWTTLATQVRTAVTVESGSPQTSIFSTTIPADTFTSGTSYDVRLRTYDTANYTDVLDEGVPQGTLGDVSDWTTITLAAITLPGAPTVTAPTESAIIDVMTGIDVEWTIDGGATEATVQILIEQPPGSGTFIYNEEFPSTRVNLCPNPSFETDTTFWTEALGTGTPTITRVSTSAKFGTEAGKIAWDASGDETQIFGWALNTVPGQVYTVRQWVYSINSSTDPQVQLIAANEDGSTVAESLASDFTSSAWSLLTTKFFAQQAVTIIGVTPVTAPDSGDSILVDGNITENGFFGTGLYFGDTPLPYFDGSTANFQTGTTHWEGTTAKSISDLEIDNILSESIDVTGTGQPGGGVLRTAAVSGPANLLVKYTAVWASDQFSPTTIVPIIFNFDPPGVPSASLTVDDDEGTMTLDIQTDAGAAVTITDGSGTFTIVTSEEEVTLADDGDTFVVTSSDADVTVTDNEDGTYTITITSSGNATTTVDVYRTDITNETDEIRIATNLTPDEDGHITFVDYGPATLTEYSYRVRAYSLAGGFEDVSL